MFVLSCNCLNVQIPVDTDRLPQPISPNQLAERDYLTLHSLVSEKENHIFASKLFHLDVSPDNTIIRVDSLVGINKLGNWVIVRCLNCHTDCYMFDKSQHSSSIYVVNKLTNNPEIIRGLNDCDDLSPAFGIVIRSHSQPRILPDSDVKVIEVLRQKVTTFITQAKHDSEEKIKEFSEKEVKRISALERRAWNDFKHVISNIENETKQDSPLSLSPPSLSPSHTPFAANSFSYNSPSPKFTLDTDDLPFELDDFSTNTTNLPPESDSSESDNSDSESEVSSIENLAHVSRSMPINFSHSPLRERVNDHVVEHIDINDIHNSMKMLAQSVTDPDYRDLPLPGRYQRSANHI